jgi:hypothetical protein
MSRAQNRSGQNPSPACVAAGRRTRDRGPRLRAGPGHVRDRYVGRDRHRDLLRTPAEALQASRARTAKLLTSLEAAKADLDRTALRIPKLRDHPEHKRDYAKLEAAIEEYRNVLAALLSVDDDGEAANDA